MTYNRKYLAGLEAMTNAELYGALGDALDVSVGHPGEMLWAEVGWRLGVQNVHDVRSSQAGHRGARLRRFQKIWEGQPEMRDGGVRGLYGRE